MFAESRFMRSCLAEYAQVFKTVCIDAGLAPQGASDTLRPTRDYPKQPDVEDAL